MHGTFPLPRPQGRNSHPPQILTILPSLMFAAMPLAIAALAALLRFGSAVKASDILDILVQAALAASP
jgi:hypothetical protein